ncbi:MAG: hypothetical protein FJX72_22280, partial [Armatimonadetes bacterium]|nr:hypothetical protein [Armatimonadota bacterium]
MSDHSPKLGGLVCGPALEQRRLRLKGRFRMRRALIFALMVASTSACARSSAQADFPIYPGVKRLVTPGAPADMPGAALVSRDAPRKVFDWYVARLKATSWELQTHEFETGDNAFAIIAMKGPDASRLIATVGGGQRG